MEMPAAIRKVMAHEDLTDAEMTTVMQRIMSGEATPAQIGGFLIGLGMKGETVPEITAAARVMRELATQVKVTAPHLVDTCGTGGDGQGTFNISPRRRPLWWRLRVGMWLNMAIAQCLLLPVVPMCLKLQGHALS